MRFCPHCGERLPENYKDDKDGDKPKKINWDLKQGADKLGEFLRG